MNTQQLIHLAVQVRNQNGGQYRNKSLCQACLMKKAGITAPEDQMEFETVLGPMDSGEDGERWDVHRLRRRERSNDLTRNTVIQLGEVCYALLLRCDVNLLCLGAVGNAV